MSEKLVSIKAKRPNHQFEEWLTKWKNEETNESKQMCYEAALQSLQKFPLPLATGRECIILKGFGEKLCKRLDDMLEQTSIVSKLVSNEEIRDNQTNNEMLNQPKVASKITRLYCPSYRSGAYALLCALYKVHTESKQTLSSGVLKKDLITLAQRFCDKSFTQKDQGSFYTAWSSMSTLVNKQLVRKQGNPAKFEITEDGLLVAKPLFNDALSDPENANFIRQIDELMVDAPSEEAQLKRSPKGGKRKLQKNPSSLSLSGSSQNSNAMQEQETFIFTPGSFKVFLLVDTQETSGSTKKDVYDEIIMELNTMCVNYEIRHLKVGDYAWICRHDETQQELVLPYVVERKRMDDFGASIKDGRFHEQKFRLKQSGIQNLIYLVESHGNNLHCGMPLGSIYQAATNTLLQDGFSLKFTDNIQKTAEYLAMFSKLLNKIFLGKTLMNVAKENIQKCDLGDDVMALMTFKEFNLSSSKNKPLKVSDMFVKQLLQLHGLSVDKALAIVAKYPTPRLLKFAYDACTNDKEAEALLANIKFGALNKKVGLVISTTIYQLYSFKDY